MHDPILKAAGAQQLDAGRIGVAVDRPNLIETVFSPLQSIQCGFPAGGIPGPDTQTLEEASWQTGFVYYFPLLYIPWENWQEELGLFSITVEQTACDVNGDGANQQAWGDTQGNGAGVAIYAEAPEFLKPTSGGWKAGPAVLPNLGTEHQGIWSPPWRANPPTRMDAVLGLNFPPGNFRAAEGPAKRVITKSFGAYYAPRRKGHALAVYFVTNRHPDDESYTFTGCCNVTLHVANIEKALKGFRG